VTQFTKLCHNPNLNIFSIWSPSWKTQHKECPVGYALANLVKTMLCANTESVCFAGHATRFGSRKFFSSGPIVSVVFNRVGALFNRVNCLDGLVASKWLFLNKHLVSIIRFRILTFPLVRYFPI